MARQNVKKRKLLNWHLKALLNFKQKGYDETLTACFSGIPGDDSNLFFFILLSFQLYYCDSHIHNQPPEITIW